MSQVKIRDMKLSDYNLSQTKYNELRYFCMQYDEKKRELKNGYGLRSVMNGGIQGGNHISKPTEIRAIRNVMLQRDIEMIEKTAEEANPDIYSWLLKNVTEGIPYEWLDVPIGRRQFYESRRYFFLLLAQKR